MLLSLLLLGVGALLDAAPVRFAPSHLKRTDKSGCFMFRLHKNATKKHQSALFTRAQAPGSVGGVWGFQDFQGFYSCDLSQQQLDQLAADPFVASVAEDQIVKALATQTGATWGLDRVDQRDLPLNQAYNYAATGKGVYIFVTDTGVLPTHSEFSGRMFPGFDAFGGNTVDCDGHGTHVAGTAAGTTYGVAKEASIVPVRVLDCGGSGSVAGIILGIDWVVRQTTMRPAVISMSLGGGFSTEFNDAVANAVRAGVHVVVAAGNSADNACNYSPASAPDAITVGSTTSTDAMSSFSSFGPCVDIFAPGSSITSAGISSNTATAVLSGTSMATPHVSGAVAVYLERFPSATPKQVADALVNAATPNKITSIGASSPNKLLFVESMPPSLSPSPNSGSRSPSPASRSPARSPSPSPVIVPDICPTVAIPRPVTNVSATLRRGAYSNSESCQAVLQAPVGSGVGIRFTSFSTESGFDFVTIYDGATASSRLLWQGSGTSLPGDLFTTGNVALVTWTSDGSVTSSGWSLNYFSRVVPSPNPSPQVPVTVGPGATNTVTVSLPMAGLVCTSPCGLGCRLNTDFASAGDTFQLVVTGQQLQVTRIDVATGWSMNLIVPCFLAVPLPSVRSASPSVRPSSSRSAIGSPIGSSTRSPIQSPSRSPLPSPSQSPARTASPASASRSPSPFIPPSPSPVALNDRCSGAIPLTCGSVVSGDTRLATSDGTSTCGATHTSGQLWYYVDAMDMQMALSLCNAATQFDTILTIYSGSSCGGLTCIASNDDAAGCGMQSSYSMQTAAGMRYYIMVHGFNGASGPFSLSMSCVNERCPLATRITCDSVVKGNTATATFDNTPACNGTTHSSPQLWYYVDTPPNTQLVASTCNAATRWDTAISIYSGSSCGSLACQQTNDDVTTCGTGAQSLVSTPSAGGRYYIMVYGYSTNRGTFALSVTCPTAITVGPASSGPVTVPLPAAGMQCPSTCGLGCRLNMDYPTATDSFQLTVVGQQLQVTRLDAAGGWMMNLIVPCTIGASRVTTVPLAITDKAPRRLLAETLVELDNPVIDAVRPTRYRPWVAAVCTIFSCAGLLALVLHFASTRRPQLAAVYTTAAEVELSI